MLSRRRFDVGEISAAYGLHEFAIDKVLNTSLRTVHRRKIRSSNVEIRNNAGTVKNELSKLFDRELEVIWNFVIWNLFRASTFGFRAYIQARMKHLQLIGLIACATFFASCESTDTAGRGNQEAKRLAAKRQQAQQRAQTDEAQENLWSAQQNTLNRDGNPARSY
jgi:hypothetical protein